MGRLGQSAFSILKARFREPLKAVNNRLLGRNIFRIERGNRFEAKGAILKKVVAKVRGHGNVVEVGRESRLLGLRIRIAGTGNRLIIADHCKVSGTIELLGAGNQVVIGSRTKIGSSFLGAFETASKIVIGEDCLFAGFIDVRTGDSHTIYDEHGGRVNPPKDVIIEDGVWVARGATLLKGVTIGKGSVIGAMSVVTGPVPPRCVAAGNPGRVVRTGITWEE